MKQFILTIAFFLPVSFYEILNLINYQTENLRLSAKIYAIIYYVILVIFLLSLNLFRKNRSKNNSKVIKDRDLYKSQRFFN